MMVDTQTSEHPIIVLSGRHPAHLLVMLTCAILMPSLFHRPASVTTNASAAPPGGTAELLSRTIDPETPTSPLITIGQAFNPVPDAVTQHPGAAATSRFLAVLRTSISAEGAADAAQPLAAAQRDLAMYTKMNASELYNAHSNAWLNLHASKIELAGDGDVATAVATAVNSSAYYLLSAARENWPVTETRKPLPTTTLLKDTAGFTPPCLEGLRRRETKQPITSKADH